MSKTLQQFLKDLGEEEIALHRQDRERYIDEDKREEFLGAVTDTHQVLETIAKDILMVWNILNRGDRFSDTEIAEPVPSIPNLGFSNRLTKFTE